MSNDTKRTRIDSMELSCRTANLLAANGYEYIDQLIEAGEAGIMRLVGMGQKSAAELRAVLLEDRGIDALRWPSLAPALLRVAEAEAHGDTLRATRRRARVTATEAALRAELIPVEYRTDGTPRITVRCKRDGKWHASMTDSVGLAVGSGRTPMEALEALSAFCREDER